MLQSATAGAPGSSRGVVLMRMATVGHAFARSSRLSARLLTAVTLAAGLTVAAGSLSQTAASAASKSPLLIGDLCSCTGPEASTISQTTDVVQAWAKSVNAKGGIDGHQVQITVKDDGYNPATPATRTPTSSHPAEPSTTPTAPAPWRPRKPG